MNKWILIIVVVVLICVAAGGLLWWKPWQPVESPTSVIDYAAMNQEALSKLPDPVQTFIIAVAALVGLDIFGKHFLLFAVVIICTISSVVIIAFMQILGLIFRPTIEAGYKYLFLTSVLIAGLVGFAEIVMMTSVPGGASTFKTVIVAGVVVTFLALRGSFSFTGLKVKAKYTQEHGETKADVQVDAPSFTIGKMN